MLSSMVQNMYIDKEWAVKEYLMRRKAGVRKKENTEETLKCWCQNLGHILDAELSGKKNLEEWTLEDMNNEEHGSPLSSDDLVTVN